MMWVLSGHSARRVGGQATNRYARWDHVQFNFQQISSKLKNFRTIPELWTNTLIRILDLETGMTSTLFIVEKWILYFFFHTIGREEGCGATGANSAAAEVLAYVVVDNNVVIKNEIIEEDFNNSQFFFNSFQKFNYSKYHIKVLLNFS